MTHRKKKWTDHATSRFGTGIWAVVLVLSASATVAAQQNRQAPVARAPQARPGAPLPQQALPVPDGNSTTVKLQFPGESVDLTAFSEYVGKTLGINIILSEGLANQRITFQAPLDVPKDQLLNLLSALVEDRGFALTHGPNGFYQIQPAANIDPNFKGDELSTTRMFRTPLVKPSALQTPITTAMASGGPTGQGATARFTPLDDLGILMVTGTPRTVDTIEMLIGRLLKEIAAQSLTRFEIVHVSAEFAKSRIAALNGQLSSGSTAPGAAPTSTGAVGGAAGVQSLINLDSRLILDPGNALIFRGSQEEARLLRRFVEMVDRVTPLIARRYTVGASASDIADAAQQLGLGTTRTSSTGGAGGTGGLGGLSGPSGAGGTGASTDIVGSRIVIDSEQGVITYFGTEAQHETFKALVDEFTDQALGEQVEIKMYKLENAEAQSVSDILESLIEDPRRQTGTSPFLPGSQQQGLGLGGAEPPPAIEGGEAGFNIRQEDVMIVADQDRNQIVIKATARQHRQLGRVIRGLDQRQPQVYIEAQIVSVTSSSTFNWSIETQVNAGQFLLFTNFGLSTPSTGPSGQPTGVKTTPGGNTGITTALIKSNLVPFIISSLAAKTNARLQSVPRILVSDNETGNVSSQREEPFSTTSQGTSTTVTGQGGTATAGTNLTVTPRISSGGYLTLTYSIELSSFDGTGTSGLQPPTQSENYDSRVQVPSDSSIVVGGFTFESNSETNSGVPILMDIPLLGNLFKTKGISRRRTTIFVFITPTIMTDENFLDLRLATDGPMNIAGIEGLIPELKPVMIPISQESLGLERSIPAEQAPAPGKVEGGE